MAVRALQIWATVVAGESPVGTRVFSLGGPPESLTLGTSGTWTIHADGVLPLHAKLHFDGERLALAPVGETTISGATIPRSGTILEAPVEVVLGSARIVFLQRAKVTRTVRSLEGGLRRAKRDDGRDEPPAEGERALEATTSPRRVLRATPSKAFAVGGVSPHADASTSRGAATLPSRAFAFARSSTKKALSSLTKVRRRAGARGEIAATSIAGVLLIAASIAYAVHAPPGRSDGRAVADRVLATSPGALLDADRAGPLTRIALANPVRIAEPIAAPSTTAPKLTHRVGATTTTAMGMGDLRVPIERRVVDAIARGDDREAQRILEEAIQAGPLNPTYSELLRILHERVTAHR